MNSALVSQKELRDGDLLLPFEALCIPLEYKEYCKTKRNKLFASIQGWPEIWNYYLLLDQIFLREFDSLAPPSKGEQYFPLILFINAHAKVRVSIELALSGCMAEARSILRDCVEYVAHAHLMLRDPQLQKVWLRKDEEEKAFGDAFLRNKRAGLFKGLNELHSVWGELSETGSHATLTSLRDRFEIVKSNDGAQSWALHYCGVDQRVWNTTLFSMLSSSSIIEETLFGDFEDRLKLDHILASMRKDKDRMHADLKIRYHMKPSASVSNPND